MWKETVMKTSGLDYYWRKGLAKESDHLDAAVEVAKAQAEISWNDGYEKGKQDGRREVYDFVTIYWCGQDIFRAPEAQEKLKGWGLNVERDRNQ